MKHTFFRIIATVMISIFKSNPSFTIVIIPTPFSTLQIFKAVSISVTISFAYSTLVGSRTPVWTVDSISTFWSCGLRWTNITILNYILFNLIMVTLKNLGVGGSAFHPWVWIRLVYLQLIVIPKIVANLLRIIKIGHWG